MDHCFVVATTLNKHLYLSTMVSKTRSAVDRLAEFAVFVAPSTQTDPLNPITDMTKEAPDAGAATSTKADEMMEIREDVETIGPDRDVAECDDNDEQSLVGDQRSVHSDVDVPKPRLFCMETSCTGQVSDDEISSPREKQAGIESFFDLIESACCGETNDLKMKAEGECGKGKTFSELAACKNFKVDDLNEGYASEDYESNSCSSASAFAKTRPSQRGRSSGRNSSRRNQRRSHEDMPRERSRSTNSSAGIQEKLKVVAEVAKKASDIISQNIKAMEMQRDTPTLKMSMNDRDLPPVVKPAQNNTSDEPTCATAESTAIASQVFVRPDHERLREVCVLSLVGSGSTVSSFNEDGGAHSWSLHTKRKVHSSPSDLTALTTNKSQVDVSLASCRRVVETVINFIDSLTRNIYARDALPVNKAVCLLCLSAIILLWPADQEKNRRKVEKVEIPRPRSPVSLLKAVLRGETKDENRAV